MKQIYLGLVVAGVISLSACSTTPKATEGEAGGAKMEGAESGAVTSGAAGTGAAEGAAISGAGKAGAALTPFEDPKNPLSIRVIYFDFDSSVVPADVRDVLTAHAQYLASNPSARVRLEGHADERGSREYNVGLGERRAHAVNQIMSLQGAGGSQLSTVSYGEERPAEAGHDESAWRLNRRVELVYTNY
ncbi:MAG: peptidoglycan-associated lipoprotein Pal [Pseudomonadota bacterium]